jgi:hypothetical protein
MTIRFKKDSIEFEHQATPFVLREEATGFVFAGRMLAIDTVQGNVSGYTSGGLVAPSPGRQNVIDKFPFATNANATDVGDLTVGRYGTTGQSSNVSGYTSGGNSPGESNIIDKFPFAATFNATDVGDLTTVSYRSTGQSSSYHGYRSGGNPGPTNVIDRFPFAIDGNATDVGDLTVGRYGPAGQSSTVSGYTSGGLVPPLQLNTLNTIDKFPFASNANATDVGDLTVGRGILGAGQSSSVSGYTSSGYSFSPVGGGFKNDIDKFSFASDANATDVGDATVSRYQISAQSSTVSGYSSGGFGPSNSNVIDRFPFATDGNATDVGDLTVGRYAAGGQQY